MRLIKVVFFAGLFVIIVPLSGLPLAWKFWLVIILGIVISVAAVFEYLELLKDQDEDGQERFDFEHIEKGIKPKARKLAVKSDNGGVE